MNILPEMPLLLLLLLLLQMIVNLNKGKTRDSNEVCYGNCRPLTPGLARAVNLPEETVVCLRHHQVLKDKTIAAARRLKSGIKEANSNCS